MYKWLVYAEWGDGSGTERTGFRSSTAAMAYYRDEVGYAAHNALEALYVEYVDEGFTRDTIDNVEIGCDSRAIWHRGQQVEPATCVHLTPTSGHPGQPCHSGPCPADYPALYACCGDDDACPTCPACGNDVAPPQSFTPGALCFDCASLESDSPTCAECGVQVEQVDALCGPCNTEYEALSDRDAARFRQAMHQVSERRGW